MSNRVRLKARPMPVGCSDCGLLFAGQHELQMHYRHLPGGETQCLGIRTMREVLGFYRSRGAWRLGTPQ